MPLEVFYSYAHEDEKLRNELDKHLRLLQRQNLIVGWHDRRIGAGAQWADQIDEHIHSAHIILLLISPDFIDSQYCYDQEMEVALSRHIRREAIVIPILLRPVNWKGAPFGHLQALPRDARPITTWPNQDEAFASIAEEIREVVLHFQPRPAPEKATSAVTNPYAPHERMLDAAIPSHIVKGEPTDLLVLIRLPDSPGLQGILATDESTDARPEDVQSKKFSVTFPRGFDGEFHPLKVTVELTAPDFLPPRQSKNIFVPPDADSDTCEFILTPTRVGNLKVLVELQWEDAMRGQRRLVTECLAEAAPRPARAVMNLVQMPLAVAAAPVHTLSIEGPSSAPLPPVPERITAFPSEPLPSSSAPPPEWEALSPAPEPESESSQQSVSSGAAPSLDYEAAPAAELPPAPPASASPGPPPGAPSPRPPIPPAMGTPGDRANYSAGYYSAGRSSDARSRHIDWESQARRSAPPMSSHRGSPYSGHSPASSPGLSGITKLVIAGIVVLPLIFVAYRWTASAPPNSRTLSSQQPSAAPAIVFSGHVLNAETLQPVPGARVAIGIEDTSPAPPGDLKKSPDAKYTDANGSFRVSLAGVTPGSGAHVFVAAPGFQPFFTDVALTSSPADHVFRLTPVAKPPTEPRE